jgi:hypothetical protein
VWRLPLAWLAAIGAATVGSTYFDLVFSGLAKIHPKFVRVLFDPILVPPSIWLFVIFLGFAAAATFLTVAFLIAMPRAPAVLATLLPERWQALVTRWPICCMRSPLRFGPGIGSGTWHRAFFRLDAFHPPSGRTQIGMVHMGIVDHDRRNAGGPGFRAHHPHPAQPDAGPRKSRNISS